ncbi:MAG: ADP-ribosylglycohydrolase family protein [Moorea sp. SIO2B7]|nr:ADP-ribosylglycohydrolase family protein [Moorena sp. SIO2B7]
MTKLTNSKVLSGLMGVCVGDALGVPVEFTPRSDRQSSPVTKMQGYGTYNQPPGTWSDDSSLTFCLAEALSKELLTDQLYETLADYFCRWRNEAFWTPHNYVFDIGNTTATAILRLQRGISPLEAGGTTARSNGNGSLMRILPIAFCYPLVDFPELIKRVHNVSCLTHGHPRSQISCGIYISIAVFLLQGSNPVDAYHQGIDKVREIYQQEPYDSEMHHFQRVISGNLGDVPIDLIRSSGYVIDALEAALWCFLNSKNYPETVLTAVNLGEDTDTTAAITGGLAGIYYGFEQIPQEWIEQIARKDDIIELAERLETAINQK